MSFNHKSLTRRDFLNGVALQGPALALATANPSFASAPVNYPPQLTGLRGTHKGAFEVAHSVAWQGKQWPIPNIQTDRDYDLIVVGAGISGLTAAMRFQQESGNSARILLLDNHDDFGGHAKRNEFNVDGQQLVGYGGSQSIDTPSSYSPQSRQVLTDLGIETERFYRYFDRDFHQRHGLKRGLFFSKQHYGGNKVVDNPFGWDYRNQKNLAAIIKQFPIDQDSQNALIEFIESQQPLLTNWDQSQKIDRLRKLSYAEFLKQYAQLPQAAIDVINNSSNSLWGIGWDALSVLEAIRLDMPGSHRLQLTVSDFDSSEAHDEPYIFHFPDGNASIARALVQYLIPSAMKGDSMESWATSKVDYNQLDRAAAPVRIRLNATAVNVKHDQGRDQVNVTYVQQGQSYRVRGQHVILACNNNIIPHICPEVSHQQTEAIEYAQKVPLVYANVAIRNWHAFKQLGYHHLQIPQAELFHSIALDFPVSMGNYQFSPSPDQPIVLHATMTPTTPHRGMSGREQHRAGRHKIYGLSFEDFENDLFTQLDGALSSVGFDVARDISAITVNRWPHGYSYEYNELFDPVHWGPKNGPHILGRQQLHRISIANADASAFAYVNGAMDAAIRAVDEQIKLG